MAIDRNRTSRIFEKLLLVAPELKQTREFAKSCVPGFMDLNLDVLVRSEGFVRIALSHYWKHPSGDMIADPDMEVAVYFNDGLAEALTYQDTYVYEVAYPNADEPPDLAVHTRLNVFLEQWLDNLAEQGHVLPRGH
jgi:uncharacterized protein YqiB (DUF1249 family)